MTIFAIIIVCFSAGVIAGLMLAPDTESLTSSYTEGYAAGAKSERTHRKVCKMCSRKLDFAHTHRERMRNRMNRG